MTVLSKIKSHSDAVDYFKELPFYNKPIKKPKVKRLKNIDRLAELPFYEQLSVIKTNQAFRGYAMSYKVEISERKDPIVQLEASKLSINLIVGEWTVQSTPINICEYFKNGLQHRFEIFLLLIFIIWGHSLKISDPYLYFCGN